MSWSHLDAQIIVLIHFRPVGGPKQDGCIGPDDNGWTLDAIAMLEHLSTVKRGFKSPPGENHRAGFEECQSRDRSLERLREQWGRVATTDGTHPQIYHFNRSDIIRITILLLMVAMEICINSIAERDDQFVRLAVITHIEKTLDADTIGRNVLGQYFPEAAVGERL